MSLLSVSHKFLCFALCSAHSVLIFDNCIIPMVATIICMQIFFQISFCSILTTISKLILYNHLNISIFPSNPPPFRNLHHLVSLITPHYPTCFLSSLGIVCQLPNPVLLLEGCPSLSCPSDQV